MELCGSIGGLMHEQQHKKSTQMKRIYDNTYLNLVEVYLGADFDSDEAAVVLCVI